MTTIATWAGLSILASLVLARMIHCGETEGRGYPRIERRRNAR